MLMFTLFELCGMLSRIHVDKESQLNDKLKILFNYYSLLEAEYSTILAASNDYILFFA